MNRSVVARSLMACAVLAALLIPRPAQAQTATLRIRIGVTADNLYHITPSDLTAKGVDVATIDPRTFSMSSLGSLVAIRVTGDADGHFDGTDVIQFFGQKFRGTTMEEKYTDERVYWLEIGGSAGPRIEDLAAVPLGNTTPPTDFATTVRAEQNLVQWNLHSMQRGEDTWFWDRFQGIVSSTGRSYAYNTPHPAPGFPATLRVEVVARKVVAPDTNPTHRVRVAVVEVNNSWTNLADETWSDPYLRLITTAVPAGKLTNPSTAFGIEVQLPSSTSKEDMYFNYWELDYRRLFRAFNNQIDFEAETAGTTEYLVSDFTSSQVAVWDVTTPAQPVRRTDATAVLSGSTYNVRFRTTPAVGDRYWLQTEGSFATPASISIRTATGLSAPAGGADTVIVTPSFLRPAAETLAAWHEAHGRRTVIADLQDVYDEFNFGIRHPVAVPNMLAWASSHWTAPAPMYLVLMGDGHHNMKGYNPTVYTKTVNPIPPYLAVVDPWVGEIAADSLYGDITGDRVPDLAVGRLPVNTLAEANTVVNKIIAYDETTRTQTWQRQAVFVAGPYDPYAGDFQAMSDEIIQNHLPADLTAQKIYMGTTTLPAGKTYTDLLVDAINSGALMVQWAGHGNVGVWSNIWNASYPASYTNRLTNSASYPGAPRLPVVMTFNCLDGYFVAALPSISDSVAETMLRHGAGGSAAAISPTGDGLVADQTPFRKILMETLFHEGVREVGRALMITKQDFAYDASSKYPDAEYGSPRGAHYLVYQMTLFGDPAMRLPIAADVPQAPVVSIARVNSAGTVDSTGNRVRLSWPAVTQDVLGADTTVTAYGIWRSTQPYFDPDAINCNCTKVAEIPSLNWVDDGSVGPIIPIGDLANNYFYVVRAQNSGGWSPNSNRTGEFDFALEPGQ